MARLLATWELGGGTGHFAALVPAARELAAQGHESWFAARDVAASARLADTPFARVLPAPLWRGARAAYPMLSFGQIIADGGFADDDGLVALVRAWLALIELAAPDGIYGDHAPASLLAAHVARLPAARLGTPFLNPPARRAGPGLPCGPALMPWLDVAPTARAAADRIADRVVRNACRALGAPVLDGLAELLATAAPLLTSWPEMDAGSRDDSVWYGPLSDAATGDCVWPVAPGPRVLVFLPFDRPAAQPLAAALAARRWPVLWMCPESSGFALPPCIEHRRGLVPILPPPAGPCLVISRASHAVGLAAMRAGIPQLLLPDSVETRTMALAMAGRGLGRLPDAWTAASMGVLMDALVDGGAPERAAAAAAAQRHRGYDAAAARAALGRDLAAALRLAG
jgi:hypothetical protein